MKSRKAFYNLFIALLIVSQLQAKVLTVSNRPGNPAQYQQVANAIAAAPGDTIYVQGSETRYEDFTIDKRLTVIGPGHKPNKEIALLAEFGGITVGVDNADASGSALIGINVNIVQGSSYAQNNITISRCKIDYIYAQGSIGGITKNWLIENNVLYTLSFASTLPTPYEFIIRNNIFSGQIDYGSSLMITNNIFIGSQSDAFVGLTNSSIHNNIFYGSSPQGAANSTFNNNISYSNSNTSLPYGTNNGINNKVDVDPLFTTYTGGAFSYDHDYHLQSTSPGKNAGTDGTDIGLYGGIGFSESGEPPIPQVRAFLIKNGVVAPNSKLSITIKAEAKN